MRIIYLPKLLRVCGPSCHMLSENGSIKRDVESFSGARQRPSQLHSGTFCFIGLSNIVLRILYMYLMKSTPPSSPKYLPQHTPNFVAFIYNSLGSDSAAHLCVRVDTHWSMGELHLQKG